MEHKIFHENGNTTHYFLATEAEVAEYFRKTGDLGSPSFWDVMSMIGQGQRSKTTTIIRYENKKDWDRYWKIMAMLVEEEKKKPP